MSATKKVLADLKRGHIVKTDIKSITRYSCTKIPDVIYKLRAKGYVIETINKLVKLEGGNKWVAEYRLVQS